MSSRHQRSLHSQRHSSPSDHNSMTSSEGSQSPTYVLEHLATFTVSQENDLLYPSDGMRRLLAMEKTNGIWTQKMLMKLDRHVVNIMDHENKEIVERFPLHLVREPTAFTSNDPKEMYNNILIYIVGPRPEESPTPAEMHIFQCVNVRARDIVEDLKHFMTGGQAAKRGPRHHHSDFHDVKVGDLSPYEGSVIDSRPGEPRLQANPGPGADETSSTASDKYEKEVAVLNKCFDDIEKFIARLQHSAAAFRELEKRRRGRKSKKKDLGDGMLSMRAKAPPEADFVDILQKFKLSFNLLAKLKACIHEPNAPELVHFLFTPLALVVDASHDSNYGPNLPAKVLAPLLTASAADLLVNCLTSKESELWHSLGDAWYVPAHEWKGYVPAYRPVFMDGWSPSVNLTDDEKSQVHESVDEVDDDYVANHSQRDIDVYPPERVGVVEEDDDDDDDGDVDELAEDEQRSWLAELQRRNCHIVQVTYPRTANNEKELTVARGEFLEVVDDSRKWWKTRNSRGQLGHVPHTIVTELDRQQDWMPRENGRRGGKGGFRYF